MSLRELLPSAAVMVDQQPLKYTDAAQATKPVNVRRFLSVGEIEQVHTAHKDIQPHAGIVARDSSGAFVPTGDWSTTYLHTASRFQTTLPDIVAKVALLAWRVDREQGWDLLKGKTFGQEVNIRVIEYSHYRTPAGLDQPAHHDTGSLLTIDLMLSSDDDFGGGQFNTVEESTLVPQQFQQGDATVFVSHKYHCVSPLTRGTRTVLIFELWEAQQCVCAHRCVRPVPTTSAVSPCGFALEQAQQARLHAGFTDPQRFTDSAEAGPATVVQSSFDFVDMMPEFAERIETLLTFSSWAPLMGSNTTWKGPFSKQTANQVQLGTVIVSCSDACKQKLLGFATIIPLTHAPRSMLDQLLALCCAEQERNSGAAEALGRLVALLGGAPCASEPFTEGEQAIDKALVGLVVHGREPHIPRQLVPPLHQVLQEDLKWAAEQTPAAEAEADEYPQLSFQFEFVLLVSTFGATGAASAHGAPSAKKRKLWTADWHHHLERVEDGFYHKHAEWSCLVGTPLMVADCDQRAAGAPNSASFVVSCIAVDKLESITAELNAALV